MSRPETRSTENSLGPVRGVLKGPRHSGESRNLVLDALEDSSPSIGLRRHLRQNGAVRDESAMVSGIDLRPSASQRLRANYIGLSLCGRSAENGFTLIEMLVALAVFSLAALALLRLEGATLSSTHELDRRTMAQIVARNLAAEVLTDPVAPTLGETKGEEVNGGSTWHWTRAARRIGDGVAIRIDIAVADEAGQAMADLTLVRRAR